MKVSAEELYAPKVQVFRKDSCSYRICSSQLRCIFEDYLYDLSVDPIEKNNLIKSPEYASVRAELKDMLINEMVKAGERKPKILPALFVRKNNRS